MKYVKLTNVIMGKEIYIQNIPQIISENILNKKFVADNPNEKRLTDITEFKITKGNKTYLSSILDFRDNSIISYLLGKLIIKIGF